MSPPRFWTSLGLATARVARAARRADLVHAIKDYPHNLAGLLGARVAGRPCVATAHGTYTVQPLLDRRHARLARWTYSRLAAMVCVSRYTRQRILDVLGPGELDPARVHVIQNAVPAEHFRERRPIAAAAWQSVPFTLTIGEVKERKGHHLALAAWCAVAARRPDLHHFIVGKTGADAYRASLSAMASEAGLAERVHFLGNVSEDEKVDLLQRAEVFLHTPVTAVDGGFEGFGIVYLEASASGTPAIGTRDCGAEDAIEDGVTGFLVEPRVEAVAGALEQLLADPDRRARMGAAGQERARRATWEENARSVLALYEDVLRRSPAAGHGRERAARALGARLDREP
jgi:glycosyltransferase involved in cell wall biosynthesis